MDPNNALRELRGLVRVFNQATDDDNALVFAADLVNVITDLDEFLTRGGFLPTDWQR